MKTVKDLQVGDIVYIYSPTITPATIYDRIVTMIQRNALIQLKFKTISGEEFNHVFWMGSKYAYENYFYFYDPIMDKPIKVFLDKDELKEKLNEQLSIINSI